jgi:hypothetical protein
LKSARNCWALARRVSSCERFAEIPQVDIDESPSSPSVHSWSARRAVWILYRRHSQVTLPVWLFQIERTCS